VRDGMCSAALLGKSEVELLIAGAGLSGRALGSSCTPLLCMELQSMVRLALVKN